MAEYIEKEATLSMEVLRTPERQKLAAATSWGRAYEHGFADARGAFIACLHRLPAADVAPVRHGKWEPVNEYCNHAHEFRCSYCGQSVFYDGYTRFCEYDFCPSCGAKMDGEEVNHG